MHQLPAETLTAPAPHCAGTLAVAAGVADVRREPDAGSEQVTQALLQTPVVPVDEARGWMRVRLSDYEGWIETAQLAVPAAATERVAVVRAPCVRLFGDAAGEKALGPVYATTMLPLLEDGKEYARVGLPGGQCAWVARGGVALRAASEPFPLAGPDVAIALASDLLGTPYLWGGVTAAGIDCSGLAQLCCRAAGRVVPRDAHQQYECIPYVVERGALRAGDLIFFAHDGRIAHVALMTGAQTYIHAKGEPESRVMVNSLDPADERYHPRLADLYAGARRPFSEVGARYDHEP